MTVLQHVECGLISGLVVGAGPRRTPGRAGTGRSRLVRPGTAAAPPLEGLQAPVEIGVQIVLLLAAGLEFIVQLVDVVVHGAQIGAHGLVLIGQIQKTLIGYHPLDAPQAGFEILQFDLYRVLFGRSTRTPRHRKREHAQAAQTERDARNHGT